MLWHLSPHPVLTLEPAALPSPPLIPPGSSCAVSLRAAGALGWPLERCMKALVAPALLPSIGQRDCDAFTCFQGLSSHGRPARGPRLPSPGCLYVAHRGSRDKQPHLCFYSSLGATPG